MLTQQRQRAACKEARGQVRRNLARDVSANGRVALYQNLMTPDQLAVAFGPNLGGDALKLQDDSEAARQSVLWGVAQPATGPQGTGASAPQPASAPQVVSLNGGDAIRSCASGPFVQVPLGPPPRPTMPLPAPAPTPTPLGPVLLPQSAPAGAPQFTNLCWALRNGAVWALQFDPGELQKLQYRCSQLGYTGDCPPPPNTENYLLQNASTLPHISVSDAVLAAIPQAPDMSGVPCAESYRMAGLTGYAPPWSDALVMDQPGPASVQDTGILGWIRSHPWLALAITGAGVVAANQAGKRGRR